MKTRTQWTLAAAAILALVAAAWAGSSDANSALHTRVLVVDANGDPTTPLAAASLTPVTSAIGAGALATTQGLAAVEQSVETAAAATTGGLASVTSAVSAGAQATTTSLASVTSAVSAGAQATTTSLASVTSAVSAGAQATTTSLASVTSAVSAGAQATTTSLASVTSAVSAGAQATTTSLASVASAVSAPALATTTSLASIDSAARTQAGSGLTFLAPVKIDQTAAAGVTVLAAADGAKVTRLHSLVGTMESAGTLTIEDSDGTDLSGPMPAAAAGGFVIPFCAHASGVLGVAGKGMKINTTQKFFGYAILSQTAP